MYAYVIAVSDSGRCGGNDGINVMFASQGINTNGPNSYFAVDLIANVTSALAVSKRYNDVLSILVRMSITAVPETFDGYSRQMVVSHPSGRSSFVAPNEILFLCSATNAIGLCTDWHYERLLICITHTIAMTK